MKYDGKNAGHKEPILQGAWRLVTLSESQVYPQEHTISAGNSRTISGLR
jgi:hypothetical protein